MITFGRTPLHATCGPKSGVAPTEEALSQPTRKRINPAIEACQRATPMLYYVQFMEFTAACAQWISTSVWRSGSLDRIERLLATVGGKASRCLFTLLAWANVGDIEEHFAHTGECAGHTAHRVGHPCWCEQGRTLMVLDDDLFVVTDTVDMIPAARAPAGRGDGGAGGRTHFRRSARYVRGDATRKSCNHAV